MIKSPLTRRLFYAFAAVLLIFALLAGILTAGLGSRALRANYERNLLERARAAALALASEDSPFPAGDTAAPRGQGRGMAGARGGWMREIRGRDLRFLDTLLMTDLWILDRDGNEITIGSGRGDVRFEDLDIDARARVEEVFAGNETVSRQFSSFLGDASLTAGVPVVDENGNAVAALFLHDRVEGTEAFLSNTALVLAAATFLAVLAVLGLGALFARRFSRPLLQMGAVTRRLAEGETGISTGIRQDDEVGALAADIDTLSLKLKESKDRESELEQLRRDFSTKLSHELKTPVAVMRGSLEALRDGVIDDPDEIRRSYDVLCAESRQLDRLISDMLELTALQNPHYRIRREALNLMDVLKDAVRSQRALAREKQIETVLETESDDIPFAGDYGRLRQMLITVLNNAVKYSKEGSVIRVNQYTEGDDALIRIQNPGPVLPPEVLENMFTQFYRGQDTSPGFGLGLSIAGEIARLHGVEITAESDVSEGTRFSFRFPSATL